MSTLPDDSTTFRPAWWLPGAQLQTIVPSIAPLFPGPTIQYVRHRWETPDGDFIMVDRLAPEVGRPDPGAATLVVFHGLEGSSQSIYVRRLMAEAAARGWNGIAINFRTCSGGVINDKPRFYHAGDSPEANWILRRIASEQAMTNAATNPTKNAAPLFAVGVSLGGNVLLKWLGEQGSHATTVVTSAVAVSAPMDLTATGDHLSSGFNLVYAKYFLKSLKKKALTKLEQYPRLFDRDRMQAAPDLRTFDDVVVAPLQGYLDVDDYYARASSKPLLCGIAVPTLILNARNDPFMPESALPRSHEVSPTVTLDFEAQGGHVGFVAAGPGGVEWLPRRIADYFEGHAGDRSTPS